MAETRSSYTRSSKEFHFSDRFPSRPQMDQLLACCYKIAQRSVQIFRWTIETNNEQNVSKRKYEHGIRDLSPNPRWVRRDRGMRKEWGKVNSERLQKSWIGDNNAAIVTGAVGGGAAPIHCFPYLHQLPFTTLHLYLLLHLRRIHESVNTLSMNQRCLIQPCCSLLPLEHRFPLRHRCMR